MKKQDPIRDELRAIAGFRLHVSIYIIISGLLWLLWFWQGGMDMHPWPLYPTVGWGVLVLLHYLRTIGYYRRREKEWQDGQPTPS